MKRGGFKKLTFAEALQKRLEKAARLQEKPATGRKTLKAGRRMKEWARAWAWLRPRLEVRGRTKCEFDFIPHQCFGPLTPAHSKKRREMVGDDIYAVSIACVNAHHILDERLTHEQMEVAVDYAIARAGGMLTPAIERAQRETRIA